MKLEEEDGLRLGNLVCIAVEEEVLRREPCDAGHAVLRHVGPDISAGYNYYPTFIYCYAYMISLGPAYTKVSVLSNEN